MTPNELKALIDLKFHGVDNFQAKILKDKNVLNKPKRTELNAIIKTGQPVHLFEQLCKMAKHYGKVEGKPKKPRKTPVNNRPLLSGDLCDLIRNEAIRQYGSYKNLFDSTAINVETFNGIIYGKRKHLSARVKAVCEILGIKY